MSEKTLEDLQAELKEALGVNENLEASKRRVEEENTKFKKRAQEVETKLSDAEKKKLEEENNLHELIKREREEKQSILDKYEGIKSNSLKEKLRTEVSKLAKDAHDIDDILRVVEAKEALKIDHDNMLIDGVDVFVTKVRELKPHLFTKKQINSNEDSPPNKENQKGLTKSEEYQKALKGAKSQKEFDNVRRKYGKLE